MLIENTRSRSPLVANWFRVDGGRVPPNFSQLKYKKKKVNMDNNCVKRLQKQI